MTATDILLHRTLASALEWLPQPWSTRVTSRDDFPELELYLESEQEVAQWQQWLTGHGGGEEWVPSEDEEAPRGYRSHRTVGEWCGWRVELVYLTEVELEAGVSGD